MGSAAKKLEQNETEEAGPSCNWQHRIADNLPKNFREYLDSQGYKFDVMGARSAGRESLAELAERARRAPRTN